jgi:hypothetical protein
LTSSTALRASSSVDISTKPTARGRPAPIGDDLGVRHRADAAEQIAQVSSVT